MPSSSNALPLLRDELVAANLEKLRMLELLPYEDAGRLFEGLLQEELASVRATMPTLQPWEGLSRRSFRIYSRGANVVRLRRLLDWVMDGERILDIGTGFGYVTTMLLRHCTVEYYCGIDLHERYLAVVEEGLRVNGASGVPHVLERLDLFKLTPEFVDKHRPTLVIVLEVLEHLRDPETALTTIAKAVPPSADLLFTVPMHGRLESVKGHLSFFDAAEIQRLCDEAGLIIQHLEPLHNVWTLVLAARSEDVTPRLAWAAHRARARRPQPAAPRD